MHYQWSRVFIVWLSGRHPNLNPVLYETTSYIFGITLRTILLVKITQTNATLNDLNVGARLRRLTRATTLRNP